jgi:hypothetical protein
MIFFQSSKAALIVKNLTYVLGIEMLFNQIMKKLKKITLWAILGECCGCKLRISKKQVAQGCGVPWAFELRGCEYGKSK